MLLSSDNRLMALQLLAEAGRISRKGLFDIMPYSYRNCTVVLKRLVDEKAIGLTPGNIKSDESHFLLAKGRKELASYNPQRYKPDLWELNDLLKKNPRQSRLCGDVAAAMSLSGYAVHPADKPGLPATTPDFKEYTAKALKTLYRNEREQPYGEILPNRTQYTKRITPMNCYYDRTQLKVMRETQDSNGIRSARPAGVLFTPSHFFRVYHGEETNIKYYRSEENHFSKLIDELFLGYRPPERKAILLVGREFKPVISLLDTFMNGIRDPNHKGTILGPENLGKPLHYLPLQDYALELLRVMRYPDWHKSIATFASQFLFGIENQPNWMYLLEGRRIYILADLNITHMAIAIQKTRVFPDDQHVFVCLPWQASFVQSQIRQHCDDYSQVVMECLPYDFLARAVMEPLEAFWGGDE